MLDKTLKTNTTNADQVITWCYYLHCCLKTVSYGLWEIGYVCHNQPFNDTVKTAQQYGDWYTGCWWVGCDIWCRTGCGPAQSPPHCTKCNNAPINGMCTNFMLFNVALWTPLHSKRLINQLSVKLLISWCFQLNVWRQICMFYVCVSAC